MIYRVSHFIPFHLFTLFRPLGSFGPLARASDLRFRLAAYAKQMHPSVENSNIPRLAAACKRKKKGSIANHNHDRQPADRQRPAQPSGSDNLAVPVKVKE